MIHYSTDHPHTSLAQLLKVKKAGERAGNEADNGKFMKGVYSYIAS